MESKLVLLLLVGVLTRETQAATCASFNDGVEKPYWQEVATCGSCISQSGCGYCMSTLRCMDGDRNGPSNNVACPNWISQGAEVSSCPGEYLLLTTIIYYIIDFK